ncbi:conserved hypothetical protein [Coccidioides posadasii str. Silveira]|uniref:Uncharacterized protein n=1 Tax=Coccidioides posadasii (strain RMSCC 757 / Silveira) TaxID=443226 RepID=E9DJW8_COCPS|nr:conserved hypothetical protein [Coccidioides posadasii str. Silveira]
MTNTSLDSDEARRHPKNPSQAHEDSPQLSHSGDDSARLNFCDKHVPDTKTTTKEVHDVGRPSLGDTVTVACTTYLYDTQEGCRGKKQSGFPGLIPPKATLTLHQATIFARSGTNVKIVSEGNLTVHSQSRRTLEERIARIVAKFTKCENPVRIEIVFQPNLAALGDSVLNAIASAFRRVSFWAWVRKALNFRASAADVFLCQLEAVTYQIYHLRTLRNFYSLTAILQALAVTKADRYSWYCLLNPRRQYEKCREASREGGIPFIAPEACISKAEWNQNPRVWYDKKPLTKHFAV